MHYIQFIFVFPVERFSQWNRKSGSIFFKTIWKLLVTCLIYIRFSATLNFSNALRMSHVNHQRRSKNWVHKRQKMFQSKISFEWFMCRSCITANFVILFLQTRNHCYIIYQSMSHRVISAVKHVIWKRYPLKTFWSTDMKNVGIIVIIVTRWRIFHAFGCAMFVMKCF